MFEIRINRESIETCLWAIRLYGMKHYGVDQSAIDIAPLSWYIGTGRASVEFIRTLMCAKPFMVARRLHMGGTYDEAIQRVKDYIGFEGGCGKRE